MLTTLLTINSEVLARNPYWQYLHDRYVMPNGLEASYYYIHTRGSVFIVPVNSDGRIVLLKQYRYLNKRESIEFPGGGISVGVLPEQQAQYELQEEAGLACSSLDYIGVMNPMNGVTDELCHVYIARGLSDVGASPDETEEFETVVMSANDIRSAIKDNTIWDGMTLAAWAMAELHM